MSVRVSRRRPLWLFVLPTARVSFVLSNGEGLFVNALLDANLFKEAFEKAQQENEKVAQ